MKSDPNPRIWMYWQGDRPGWIGKCMESVQRHGDGRVTVLDDESFDRLRDTDRDIDLSGLYVAYRADYLRAYLLARHGGLWVDADCIALRGMGSLAQTTGTGTSCSTSRALESSPTA